MIAWDRTMSERTPISQSGTKIHYRVMRRSIKPSLTEKSFSIAACQGSASRTGRMLPCRAMTLKGAWKKKWVLGRRTDETQPTFAQRSHPGHVLRVRPSVQAENANSNFTG